MARRSMAYSNTDGCFDGGRTMYSNTADECYDSGSNSHGHGGMNMYSNSNTTTDMYDSGSYGHGHGGMNMYSNTTEEECYGGGQGYYKREEKQHKNRERMGEVGALATGAFALYEGYEVKKDPAHAQRHKIEAGLAGAAALGGGGYAFLEHRKTKMAGGRSR